MSKIVIGYDGSDASKRALERAASLANGDEVIVVSAVHQLLSRGGMAYDPVEAEQHELALAEAKARLAELGVEARTVEEVGDPAKVLAMEAEANAADLIIVGSEGKNALERLFEGSVSAAVTQKAKTDVLVIH
jgi:nucleotide-binding universal stress UspA family protein